jgi:cytochrome c553
MKLSVITIAVVLTVSLGAARAADIEAGKAKGASVCASCHGVTGISAAEGFPNLAGQKAGYLANALKAFRSGDRKAPIMNNMAANLTDGDIENIAAYFSSLKACP